MSTSRPQTTVSTAAAVTLENQLEIRVTGVPGSGRAAWKPWVIPDSRASRPVTMNDVL